MILNALFVVAECMTFLLGYIGPGVGLQFFGYAVALLFGLLIAVVMVLLYPLRLYLKSRKMRKQGEEQDDDEADAGVTPKFQEKE